MAETRFGTFDELLSGVDDAIAAIARRLRVLVFEVDPEAVEVVRLGDGAATYGVGPRKMIDGYVYITPRHGHVNVGFFRATSLDDPDGLLEGTGKTMRHIKILDAEAARLPALRRLLAAAHQERAAATG